MNATLIGLALAIGAPSLKDAPKPAASPIGEWTIEASVVGGKPDIVQGQAPIDKIVITAERWEVMRNGQLTHAATVTFDPKPNPPHLDFDADGKGNGTHAVYKVDGDTLTIAYTLKGDRPAQVESTPDSQIRMMTLKRIKK